jgi:putative membrane protein
MQFALLPAATLILLASCSPGNRGSSETGMADGGGGGFNSRDTIASSPTDSSAASGGSSASASSPISAVLSQMNVSNTTEIQLASMAAKKAASPKVKQIATKLATDHAKNREQVRALAQKLSVSLTPGQGGDVSSADSAAMPPDLQGKSGRDFDRAFIQHELSDHQSNIEKLQTQVIPSAQNAEVKAYLQKTVTEMQGHLASLKQVQRQLGS